MRWILFLARVTLLCNFCFALSMVIRYTGDFIKNKDINSYIIILGLVAVVVNLFLNILQVILLLSQKKFLVPSWLLITNFIFLVMEIIFYA